MTRSSLNVRVIVFASIFLLAGSFSLFSQELGAAPQEKRPVIGLLSLTKDPALFVGYVSVRSYAEAYRQLWRDVAAKKGYRIEEGVAGATTVPQGSVSVDALIEKGVNGIMIYQFDPAESVMVVRAAIEAELPVAVGGFRPAADFRVPYIGYAAYADGREAGRAAATQFRKSFPDVKPRILIAGSDRLDILREREDGFVDGFLSVASDAAVLERLAMLGDVIETGPTVEAALVKYPGANVLFGADELRTLAILSALAVSGDRNDPAKTLVAGVGASPAIMNRLSDPDDPLRVLNALPLRGTVLRAVQVLENMIGGNPPAPNSEEYLVRGEILVDPSQERVTQYLDQNWLVGNDR